MRVSAIRWPNQPAAPYCRPLVVRGEPEGFRLGDKR